MIGLNVLVVGYFVCGSAETCCDAAGAGGICCTVCQDCVSGACPAKTDNTACGTGLKCCSGVCIDILSDEANCGFCGTICNIAPNCLCSNGTCVEGACP